MLLDDVSFRVGDGSRGTPRILRTRSLQLRSCANSSMPPVVPSRASHHDGLGVPRPTQTGAPPVVAPAYQRFIVTVHFLVQA
jgi:hypothetical protein